jgi:hypothetical protein
MTNLPEAVNRVVRVFGVTPLYVGLSYAPQYFASAFFAFSGKNLPYG